MSVLEFQIEKQLMDSDGTPRARAGRLTLDRGDQTPITVETPMFMPVGTAGSVKTMSSDELTGLGSKLILANTYHLYLRPGHERIERLGGLHRFMNWDGAILTDSGGFQVFSLSKINKRDDEGVTFFSHLDGSAHRFTPEHSMRIQRALGSNIVMAFDECPPYPAPAEEVSRAVSRTFAWARRGLEVELKPHQARFGIVQGGLFEELRLQSAAEITGLPFDGFALGGLSIGETPELMQKMTRFSAPLLPVDRPRYLMGVGRPEDLVEGVRAGVDLFDCVMPTRNARNGQVFTSRGKMNLRNARFAEDQSPLDPDCNCEVCRKYTRAYLRHLYVSHEILALRLGTMHNLSYYLELMRRMRRAIVENRFDDWAKEFYTMIHDKNDSSCDG